MPTFALQSFVSVYIRFITQIDMQLFVLYFSCCISLLLTAATAPFSQQDHYSFILSLWIMHALHTNRAFRCVYVSEEPVVSSAINNIVTQKHDRDNGTLKA